jgi:type IV pilus assembly protein PilA
MIELMVVLLVMAILLAIAIPTFLGTTAAADDRSAQSNLITAFTAAKTVFQNSNQSYDLGGPIPAVTLANALQTNQLQLQFKAGILGTSYTTQGSSGLASDISVSVSSDGVGVVLAAFSVPGNCFYVVDNTGPLTGAAPTYPPYSDGTAVTDSTSPQPVSGALDLPTSEGTAYVDVSGDVEKSDCNAATPTASGPDAKARYQVNGFPA